jgi:hypothetical protein
MAEERGEQKKKGLADVKLTDDLDLWAFSNSVRPADCRTSRHARSPDSGR